MAELGTIAAAWQITETLFKFKKLWTDIHNASEDLSELVEEVSVQAEILDGLHQQTLSSPSPVDDKTWRKCQALYKRAVVSLQTLVDDLSLIKQTHKKTGLVRLYLRRDDMRKYKEQLQRVQSNMFQAQLSYTFAVSSHNDALILDALGRLQQPQQPTNKLLTTTRKKKQQKHPCRKMRSNTINPKPFIHINRRSSKATQHKSTANKGNTTSSISLRFPTWTVWKCVHIQMQRSNRSLGINLRIYNTCPSDSDLFNFGRNGDWTQVHHMLTKRLASPFDVDEWGTTLLHIAASQARFEVCRYLMDQGLDASCQTWKDKKTPLETLALTFRHNYEKEPSSQNSLQTTRLLLKSVQDSDLEYSTKPDHWFYHCSLPPPVLKFLIPAVVPNYYDIDPAIRARIAMATTASDSESVRVLLGSDLTLDQAFKLTSTKPGRGYGHRQILFNASRFLAKSSIEDPRRTGWLSIIKSLISFESENEAILTATKFQFRSMYMHYIAFHMSAHPFCPCSSPRKRRKSSTSSSPLSSPSSSPSSSNPSIIETKEETTWNTHLTSIGKQWLEILSKCGANLKTYSKAEQAAFRRYPETIIWRSPNHSRSKLAKPAKVFRLKYMSCGDDGDDIDGWKIHVVPTVYQYSILSPHGATIVTEGHREYEMAGSFWNFVENPELFGVPGSFLDDHYYDRDDDEDVDGCGSGSGSAGRLNAVKHVDIFGPIYGGSPGSVRVSEKKEKEKDKMKGEVMMGKQRLKREERGKGKGKRA